MKKITSVLLMAALLVASVSAMAAGYTAGTYEAAVKGFGGEVKAVMTFNGDSITDIVLTGEGETPAIGGAALEAVKSQILEAQSTQIDGVAGATVTTEAVKAAAELCIAQAAGIEAQKKVAADGVYTGSAFGFMSNIGVEVTVKDHVIAGIRITENGDTGMIGGAAADKLAGEIVREQSLAVDAIAGATVTSNAVFAAAAQALESAGADVMAMKNAAVEKRAAETKEMQTQVVVVGAGMAGLSAALEAADQGLEVILLEKLGVFSGSATRSEGFVMGSDTAYQKTLGIMDSTDDMYEDFMVLYGDEPELDTALLRKTVEDSAELIDFLMAHTVEFETIVPISAIAPRNDPRAHVSVGKGNGLIQKMVESAQASDKITILLNTPATSAIVENGAVVGVKATNQYGDDITVKADATILCAGSYGGDIELVKKMHGSLNPVCYMGCGDGSGWTIAEGAGAKMVVIGYMSGEYAYLPYQTVDYSIARPGASVNASFDVMQVDKDGKRLINEDAFTFDFGDMVYDSGATYGWAIGGKAYDEANPKLYTDGLNTTYTVDGKQYCRTYRADTVEELAALTGMNAQTLKNAVERYNASCDAGVDEEFGKNPKYMVRIDAPYTAYMLTPAVSDGYSGCAINEHAQVIGANGEAIPGFYAAGGCAMPQLAGNRYYGCGTQLMISGVYGRAAAAHAASLIK
ncbi:MAG: FAD-dependent oxidoreductase [Alistipes sp.]|nr:FAD-dependent oxidoreductase [Alistipes sp.]